MKTFVNRLAIGLLAGLLVVGGAWAQGETGTGEGEVRRIDKATGKVTLRHGPVQGLDMPAMTMVFQTRDPALLARLKIGDKVRFTASRDGKALTLESVEPAP